MRHRTLTGMGALLLIMALAPCLLADTVDNVSFTYNGVISGDYDGPNSATISGLDLASVERQFGDEEAIEMTVNVSDVVGSGTFSITEVITNNAGNWGDFKLLLNPGGSTDGLAFSNFSISAGDWSVAEGTDSIIIESNSGIIAPGVFTVQYDVTISGAALTNGSGSFTVQAVDAMAIYVPVPTPSAGVGLIGMCVTVVAFGVRRRRK